MTYEDAESLLLANGWKVHSRVPRNYSDAMEVIYWKSPRLPPTYWEYGCTLYRPCNLHLQTADQRAHWAGLCSTFNADRIADLPDHLVRDKDFLAAMEMCPHV